MPWGAGFGYHGSSATAGDHRRFLSCHLFEKEDELTVRLKIEPKVVEGNFRELIEAMWAG